jgi:NitT/TauT family transport system substrate-binding protein
MKLKLSFLTLTVLGLLSLSHQVLAETINVFYNPYDTTSFQAIISDKLGLWKKYAPKNVVFKLAAATDDETIVREMVQGNGAIAV